jgi:hypothetical protein
VGDAVLADRAEEHARELAVTAVSHDEEIRIARFFDEHQRRVPLFNQGADCMLALVSHNLVDGL